MPFRLYDRETLQPRTVVVDDRIPCDKDGQPLFAKPNGKEAWVLLLEKAFAKMWGSYQALDGCADAAGKGSTACITPS